MDALFTAGQGLLRRLRGVRLLAGLVLGAAGPLAFAASCGASAPAMAASPAIAAPVAVAARIVEEGRTTILRFDLSRRVAASTHVLTNPARVVVDLPEVNFQIEAPAPPAAGKRGPARGKAATGLISSYRFGLFAPGKSRIVIDLAGPARVERVDIRSLDGGEPARMDIVLAPASRAEFEAAAAPLGGGGSSAAGAVSAAPVAEQAGKPVVVIDPGHGGVDGGAAGRNGIIEKDIVFDVAKSLAKKIEQTGRYKVLLTRDSDVFVSLGERVRIARDARAALFVSLHADSLVAASDVRGATIYTVSDRASDAEAARLAEKENAADLVAGAEVADDAPDVADILFDLTRRETRAYAHVFSRSLAGYMQQATRMHSIPNRSAGFKVLKAPDVPSVLVELGYLTNEREAQRMTTAEWRDGVAAAMASAIDNFLAGQARAAPAADVGTTASTAPARGKGDSVRP